MTTTRRQPVQRLRRSNAVKNLHGIINTSELNEDEKKDFLSNFGSKIPFLLKTDPIVRYFNFEKGDIIKVIRKDNYISYRIVK